MFTEKSFKVFELETLEMRLPAIRSEIHPVMSRIGQKMIEVLSQEMPDRNFYLHLAQHIRRRVNPPEITLSGISENKRGYKMMPHFQISICQDYVAVLLGIIDDPKERITFGDRLLDFDGKFPVDFKVSKDHMSKEFFDLSNFADFAHHLKNVKKADFEIGRVWPALQFNIENESKYMREMLETIKELIPLYLQIVGD
ncbi:DUF1054 family protein [Lactovum miscens]|uniref:Uncharacterized protein YktB (UPF0637 family) n=1 Tax=Lactovum miscens TaxID=190387 RepID=A0A841C9P9_9LACT|nr:DUF1054 family protein [Lactovum miscens]MBB5888119.1 uncharacterized protein YktB (UPF0637 family) [Lactovum miscens]